MPAIKGRPLDARNGEVTDAAMGEVGLKDEGVVSGLQCSEIVAVGDGFGGSIGGFEVDRGEGDKAVAVDDERSPGIENNLIAGFGDDLDVGEPVAFFGAAEGDVYAGVRLGEDADAESSEVGFFEGIALQVAHFVGFDEDTIATVVGAIPRAVGSVDSVAGEAGGAGVVVGAGVAEEGGFLAEVIGSDDPDLGVLDGFVVEPGAVVETDAEAMLIGGTGDVADGKFNTWRLAFDLESVGAEGGSP